jgi:hypothetical protein
MLKVKCPVCGANKMANSHALTPGLVSALKKMAQYCVQEKRRVVTKKELNKILTFSESANWTKLRFHALIAKVKDEDGKNHGKWIITRLGWQFLRGGCDLPKIRYSFRNRVVSPEEINIEAPANVSIAEVNNSEPYFETIEDVVQIPAQQLSLTN